MEDSEVSSLELEAKSDYKSRDSLKGSQKSNKAEVLRPVKNKFRTALEYTNYFLAKKSLLYNVQVAKHVAKLASMLQVQKNAKIFDQMDLI